MTSPRPSGSGRAVLDGGFRVLRALADAGPAAGVSAIARTAELPRPTVHRLLAQLVEVGAVDRVGNGYVPAADLALLARRCDPAVELRRAAAGILEGVREETGATVTLVVPDRDHVRAVRTVHGRDPFPFDVYDGMALPGSCAAGIVLEPRRDPSRLDQQCRAAVDNEHLLAGLWCYAAPVTAPSGGVVAALQIGTFGRGAMGRHAPVVHHAAREVAARLPAGDYTLYDNTTGPRPLRRTPS